MATQLQGASSAFVQVHIRQHVLRMVHLRPRGCSSELHGREPERQVRLIHHRRRHILIPRPRRSSLHGQGRSGAERLGGVLT